MKKEKKNDIYYIKVPTFRRTLELIIWWDEELYREVFKGSPYEDDYNLTSWFYYFDEDNNCNIIWLKEYDLSTLAHELVHCVEWMAHQVWLEMTGEPIAFIYEELITKIWYLCWSKFKLNKITEKYFFEE